MDSHHLFRGCGLGANHRPGLAGLGPYGRLGVGGDRHLRRHGPPRLHYPVRRLPGRPVRPPDHHAVGLRSQPGPQRHPGLPRDERHGRGVDPYGAGLDERYTSGWPDDRGLGPDTQPRPQATLAECLGAEPSHATGVTHGGSLGHPPAFGVHQHRNGLLAVQRLLCHRPVVGDPRYHQIDRKDGRDPRVLAEYGRRLRVRVPAADHSGYDPAGAGPLRLNYVVRVHGFPRYRTTSWEPARWG